MFSISSLLAFLALTVNAAKYEQYILAPNSRTLHPASVYKVNGTVDNAESLVGAPQGSAAFRGISAVTFDYGKNIAGRVSLNIGQVSDSNQYIGVTFSESSLWISGEGSDATHDAGIDEILWFRVTGPGVYTAPPERVRGAFRYLSLVHNSTGSVEVTGVTTNFTAMPHYDEEQLRNYTGYFHCNDGLLNRIWYAGAYTNQLCTIDPRSGNALIFLGIINSTQSINYTLPWYNNYTITNGTSTLVDGAKRDRLVWAGDMAIAVPGIVVSYNDLISVQNALNSLFAIQNTTTGQLPYAGRPFFYVYSATYHLYTLIGVADYYLYGNDFAYLESLWNQWKLAMNYSLSFVDETGLMNVTVPFDWLRFGMGGHNIEANSILYYTLKQGLMLASAVNDTSVQNSWQAYADGIKSAANRLLWNDTSKMFRDNETTSFEPQDGNCWAVVAGITDSAEQNAAISANLAKRWTPYGAPAPEAADAISPFISGFELQAHALAGNISAALDLMRLQWGFMLDDPRMTNSTFVEGYSSTGALHYAPTPTIPESRMLMAGPPVLHQL